MKWRVLACKKNTGFPLHCVLWFISIQESQYISSVTKQGRISIPRSGESNVGVFKCVRKLHVSEICVCFVQFRSFACKDLSTLKLWEKMCLILHLPPSSSLMPHSFLPLCLCAKWLVPQVGIRNLYSYFAPSTRKAYM